MGFFDRFAAQNAGHFVEFAGRKAAWKINQPELAAFTVDVVESTIRGSEQFNSNDNTTKLLTASGQIKRSDFERNNVTQIPMLATVDAYGLEGWVVDMAQSELGPVWVKLALLRETLVSEYNGRRHAAV